MGKCKYCKHYENRGLVNGWCKAYNTVSNIANYCEEKFEPKDPVAYSIIQKEEETKTQKKARIKRVIFIVVFSCLIYLLVKLVGG